MSLTKSEKNLLTLIGKNSSISRSTLQQEVKYKRLSTLSTKINYLMKKRYIKGPYYYINLNAVGENRIHSTFVEIRFSPEQYDLVFKLITCINCWEWIFPTIQGDTFFAFFRSNSTMYLSRLLNIVKDAGLTEYKSYTSQARFFVENPDFFGNPFPHVSHVFNEVTADMIYPEKAHNTTWKFIDLKVMQYLQVKTCSIAKIQKTEKKVYNRFWRRSKIKYSIKKIIDARIAERKHYNISPYPRGECSPFLLVVEGDHDHVLPFIVNFGKGCRMYKTYTMCEDIGFVLCWASPQVGPALMKELDNLRPHIQTRCLQLKSAGHEDTLKQSFNEKHFDLENQRWIFPFRKYEEKIEKILKKEKID
ncbi:MAG: hypothetical protein PVF58_16020 [Candidatus Methanofastidiosia archaeon]